MSGERKKHAIRRGVRAVALIEAAKGALVLLVGFGLLALIHRDVQSLAENLVRHAHLNPARHTPRVFIDTAARLDDHRLWLLSAAAFGYSGLRFAEGIGLWLGKPWATWFAVLSGAVYLPVEADKLLREPSWITGTILATNAAIVVYLFVTRERHGAGPSGPTPSQSEG